MWKMELCVEQHIHGPNPPAPACLPPSPSQTTLEEEGLPWLSPYFWGAILSFVPSGIVPGSPLPSAALFFGDFLESLNSDPAVCFSPLVHSRLVDSASALSSLFCRLRPVSVLRPRQRQQGPQQSLLWHGVLCHVV